MGSFKYILLIRRGSASLARSAFFAFAAGLILSGCFKEWSYEEVQSWYDKKPENFDQYMQYAREKTAQGKTEQAIKLYSDAMQQTEAMYGAQDPRIATAAEELGDLQDTLGRFHDAELSYKKALEVRNKILSPKSSDVVDVRKKLASVLMKQYKADEAKEVLAGNSLAPGKGKGQKRYRRHRRMR